MSAPGESTSAPSPSLPTLPVLKYSLPVLCACVSARIHLFIQTLPPHISRTGWQLRWRWPRHVSDSTTFSPGAHARTPNDNRSANSPARVTADADVNRNALGLWHTHTHLAQLFCWPQSLCACLCIRLCVIQCAATPPVPRSLLCCCASDQICLPQPVCHLWRVHARARSHKHTYTHREAATTHQE